MSDTEEALRLTKTEKWYAKTALGLLAETYTKENKSDHAEATRQLAARVEAHRNERRPYQAADANPWQQRIVQCQGHPEKIKAAMREWWTEILAVATDPAGTLAESMLPLVDQSVQQGVAQVLVTVQQKMKAVATDPSLSEDPQEGPYQALEMVMQFIQDGLRQLQEGQPMWVGDRHLEQIAQQIQQQQSQQPTQ